MKPILIFFYGDSNTGKTNVLKKLGEWFHHRCTEYFEIRKASDSTDLKLSIRYKEKACRIGIGTSGDKPSHVKENLEFFRMKKYFPANEWGIFITAAHKPHSDGIYQEDADVAKLLKKFLCIDIARKALPVDERCDNTVSVKLVREDELFVYLQTVIEKRQPMTFSLT